MPKTEHLPDVVPQVSNYRTELANLQRHSRERTRAVAGYVHSITAQTSQRWDSRSRGRFKSALEGTADLTNVLFSIHFGTHHKSQSVGVSIYDAAMQYDSRCRFIQVHFVAKETTGEEDDHEKDKFHYGNTIIMPKKEITLTLNSLVEYYFRGRDDMGARLICHDYGELCKGFRKFGIPSPPNLRFIDLLKLQDLTMGLDNSSLRDMLRGYNMVETHYENSGNAAHYTLMLAMRLGDIRFRADFQLERNDAKEWYDEQVKTNAPKEWSGDVKWSPQYPKTARLALVGIFEGCYQGGRADV